MSFLKDLSDVYDQNQHLIGKEEFKGKENEFSYRLLPMFHSTQNAHIEVTLSEKGEFVTARVLEKGVTLLPITIESLSRTSGITPHPLHDKLIYLDPNYPTFVENGKDKQVQYFESYIENLKQWNESSYSHPFIHAVYQYLSQNSLIKDLTEQQLLLLNENGTIINKWKGPADEKPSIFKVVMNSPKDAFVRFRMFTEDGEIYEPWADKALWDCHIAYQESLIEDEGICYVTGETTKLMSKHPKFIRSSGDQRKLISSPQDHWLLTFKGLFETPEQAVTIGAETSFKAHNTLKWLIQKQGFLVGDTIYLVFSKGTFTPELFLTELDALFMDELEEEKTEEESEENLNEITEIDFTEEVLAQKLKALTNGFKKEVSKIGDNIIIMSIDAANKGRIAITDYIQLEPQQYFEFIKQWQVTAAWPHRTKGREYSGAPSVYTIVQAAYGPRAKDALVQKTMKRLIPCILEQKQIPRDILNNVIQRAIKPYSKDDKYQKIQAINVACSLIKHNHGGNIHVTLDEENTDRSYLFGRLLAIAEMLEGKQINWKRETNAERMMKRMYAAPQITWQHLQFKIQPYFRKKNEYISLQRKCKRMMDEILCTLGKDFNNNPLTPEFLIGYNTQRRDFYSNKKQSNTNGENEK